MAERPSWGARLKAHGADPRIAPRKSLPAPVRSLSRRPAPVAVQSALGPARGRARAVRRDVHDAAHADRRARRFWRSRRAPMSPVAAATTFLINPLTIPPMYYAAYHLGMWELHHHRKLGDPEATAQVSGTLARIMFWIHEASGPIAVGRAHPCPRRGRDRLCGVGARLAPVARNTRPFAAATLTIVD